MKILVSGACGHMGRELRNLIDQGFAGAELFGGIDPMAEPGSGFYTNFDDIPDGADCIIDFSNHQGTLALTDYAVSAGLPLILATTGQTESERAAIFRASEQIPVFFAANYSVGVTLLINTAKKIAEAMPGAQIEIVETHHNRKLDAPSGTALAIARAVQSVRPGAEIVCGRSGQAKRTESEIGIQSVRIGNIVGIHEVLVGTQNETITLKHEAHSRAVFAEGALTAAAYLIGKPAGLYDMNSMLSD